MFEAEMLELMRRSIELTERQGIQIDVLNAIVDRTGNTREGYYSLRRIMDLQRAEAQALPSPTEARTPLEILGAVHDMVAALQRVCDAIDVEISRLDT